MRSALFVGLALVAVAATTPIGPASVLDAPVPDGFEFASEPAVELDFEQYADLAHDAVEHVDSESAWADEMTAAVDVWTAGADDILLREVTLWGDDAAAAAYVDQAAGLGIEQEFDVAESPVDGGVAYVTASAGLWTRTATWQQGRYALTVEHFSLSDNDGGVLRQAARSLRDTIESATGSTPAAETATGTSEPGAGGQSVGMLLLGVAAMALSAFLILRFFRSRRRHRSAQDGERLEADDVGGLS